MSSVFWLIIACIIGYFLFFHKFKSERNSNIFRWCLVGAFILLLIVLIPVEIGRMNTDVHTVIVSSERPAVRANTAQYAHPVANTPCIVEIYYNTPEYGTHTNTAYLTYDSPCATEYVDVRVESEERSLERGRSVILGSVRHNGYREWHENSTLYADKYHR